VVGVRDERRAAKRPIAAGDRHEVSTPRPGGPSRPGAPLWPRETGFSRGSGLRFAWR